MIETRRTGAIISQLRKQKDWTQLQLADRLFVTHQAVSRWESGESFPDLALLDALSQIFEVRVDYLLYGDSAADNPSSNQPAAAQNGGANSANPGEMEASPAGGVTLGMMISDLARGRTNAVAHLLDEHPEKFAFMLEAAPITPPSVMKGVIQQMDTNRINFEQLLELAPFLDSDTLLHVFEEMDPSQVQPEMVCELAPFLKKEALNQLVDQILSGVMPARCLEELAPFLSRKMLDRVLEAVSQEGPIGLEQLEGLAPHLSQESLHLLALRYENGEFTLHDLADLLPFFSRETIDRLLDHAIARGEEKSEIEELLPFLSKERIGHMLTQVLDGTLESEWLSELAPHMDREALNQLVRERSRARGGSEPQ